MREILYLLPRGFNLFYHLRGRLHGSPLGLRNSQMQFSQAARLLLLAFLGLAILNFKYINGNMKRKPSESRKSLLMWKRWYLQWNCGERLYKARCVLAQLAFLSLNEVPTNPIIRQSCPILPQHSTVPALTALCASMHSLPVPTSVAQGWVSGTQSKCINQN